MAKKQNPAKFDRCVKALKKRGGAANAYAVCKVAGTRKNKFVEPSTKGQVAGGRKTKKNPSGYAAAAQASEEFHGTPPHEEFNIVTKIFEHDHLGDIGELVKLEVIPVHGGGVIDLTKFKGARLAQSPKGSKGQLYIEGGNQSVDLDAFEISEPHELEVLGKLKYVTYYTVKHHLGRDGGEANYRHKLNDGDSWLIRRGTNSKNRPTVVYDVNNKLLSIAGGEYKILPEGIDN